jgi:Fungal specific transcription factor domain
MYASSFRMYEADEQLRLWLSLGVILRVALKMGLHRDPSNFSFITPFEAEMRRRIWSNIYVFDVLTSFAIGLPGMFPQIQSDVRPPRNLLDTDFGPESRELPPTRPSSELSPVSYSIAKAAIVKIFAKAADISHSVELPDYAEVQKLSAELDFVHDNIKPPLKYIPMQEWILDPPPVIFNRFKLEIIYQKSRCVLHRRYLLHPLAGEAEQRSRMECVDAAMQILHHLEEIFLATQPGGQLSTKPFFFSFRANDDFLLAAMILCLELSNSAKYPDQKALDEKTISDMNTALEKTYMIYTTPSEHYTPPEKAVKALEIMMKKINSSDVPSNGTYTDTADIFGLPQTEYLASPDPTTSDLFANNTMIDPRFLSLEPYDGNFSLGENLSWVSAHGVTRTNCILPKRQYNYVLVWLVVRSYSGYTSYGPSSLPYSAVL